MHSYSGASLTSFQFQILYNFSSNTENELSENEKVKIVERIGTTNAHVKRLQFFQSE